MRAMLAGVTRLGHNEHVRSPHQALAQWFVRQITRPRQEYRRFVFNDPDRLKSRIRPGDIVLVDGDQRVSQVIKYLTMSSWSHTAIYIGSALVRNPVRRLERAVTRQPRHPDPLPPRRGEPAPRGPHAVQVLRTYPLKRPPYPFARKGERSIARAYLKAFPRARRLVYLEDLGDITFESRVQGPDEEVRRRYYRLAIDELVAMQKYATADSSCIAFGRAFDYDLLKWELDHFREFGIEAQVSEGAVVFGVEEQQRPAVPA